MVYETFFLVSPMAKARPPIPAPMMATWKGVVDDSISNMARRGRQGKEIV